MSSIYVSSGLLFGTDAGDGTSAFMLGVTTAVVGMLIMLLAPMLGQGTDRPRRWMFHLYWQA